MKRLFTRIVFLALAAGLFQPTAFAVSPMKPATGDPDPSVVKTAVESFRNLSKKERDQKIKLVKAAMKEHKQKAKGSSESEINTLLLVLITILIPPLGVYLHQGEINTKFWISLILTLLFYFPGLIYSLIVILGTPGGSNS